MHTGARFLFARCIHNGQGEITKPPYKAAHAQSIKRAITALPLVMQSALQACR
jgi:hypothetical protein